MEGIGALYAHNATSGSGAPEPPRRIPALSSGCEKDLQDVLSWEVDSQDMSLESDEVDVLELTPPTNFERLPNPLKALWTEPSGRVHHKNEDLICGNSASLTIPEGFLNKVEEKRYHQQIEFRWPTVQAKVPPASRLNSTFSGTISIHSSTNQGVADRKSLVREKSKLKIETKSVFGCRLDDSTIFSAKNPHLPVFFEKCTTYIKEKGLRVEGIFRLSGSLAKVTKLRKKVEKKGGDVKLNKISDPHIVASVFKAYMRETPDMLLPRQTLVEIMNFYEGLENEGNSIENQSGLVDFIVQKIFLDAPGWSRVRLEVFLRLLDLMASVCENSHFNRMDSRNLSIVLGPTLIQVKKLEQESNGPESSTGKDIGSCHFNELDDLQKYCAIMQILIENSQRICQGIYYGFEIESKQKQKKKAS